MTTATEGVVGKVLYTMNQEGGLIDDFPRVKTIQTKNLQSYFSNCEPCEITIEANGSTRQNTPTEDNNHCQYLKHPKGLTINLK